MRFLPRAAAPALVGALLVAGCGSTATGTDTDAGTGASTTSTGAPSPTSPTIPTSVQTPPPPGDPTDPPLPSSQKKITATGPVQLSDIEGPCILMTISGRTYQLVGDGVAKLRDGQRVSVTGHLDGTLNTTCQVGPVLVVTELAPAG